jgi:4-hydroxybenzoate polyprenyltransferase
MTGDPRAEQFLHRTWQWVLAADRFVRIHYLSFSAIWPLLGAATVHRRFRASELVALLAVTCCFHAYAMLLNDVIDLPIDRTQPKRQRDPLVRGAIAPRQVLAIVLVQPLLTVPLTIWLGGTLPAHAALGAGFAMMAAYNLWGKRCPFPPLLDAIQGLAWASLALYGALVLGAAPNAMTWLVAAYVTAYTLLVNGVHGPLRDLDNDFATGARTTAIFLGTRPASDAGHPVVPRPVAIYDAALRAGLIGVLVALFFRTDFGYSPLTWAATAIVVAAIAVLLVVLHAKVVQPRRTDWEAAFRLDVFLLTMSVPVAFGAYASANVLLVWLALNALAIALFPSTPAVARWAWLAIAAAVRPAHAKRLATRIPRTD